MLPTIDELRVILLDRLATVSMSCSGLRRRPEPGRVVCGLGLAIATACALGAGGD